MNYKDYEVKIKNLIILAAISFVVLSVFSTCSYLYDINPWSDANLFFTIGRGIKQGEKLYVDIFDHKGPILYYIYLLASFISDKSFIGVFIIEVLFNIVFLLFTQKIIKLYFKESNSYLFLLIIQCLICSSNAFNYGGGSVEEYMMPLMVFVLYICLKNIHNKQSFSRTDCIFIGLMIFITIFTKYNLCGFYLGIILVLIIYQYNINKDWLFSCILTEILSFLIPSIMLLILSGINGTLSALIDTYFIFNLFGYSSSSNVLFNIFSGLTKGFAWFIKDNILIMMLIIVSIISYVFNKEIEYYEKVLLVFSCSLCYIFSIIGGIHIKYYVYPLYLSCFTVYLMYKSKFCINDKWKLVISILLIGISFFVSNNTYRIGKDDIVQNQVIKMMNNYSKSPTLLMYNSYDEGFYLKANYIPSCKYISVVNGYLEDYDYIINECIEKEQYDFLIYMDKTGNDSIMINGYQLLDVVKSKYKYDDDYRYYYLLINTSLIGE